jgi:hypothetical protein
VVGHKNLTQKCPQENCGNNLLNYYLVKAIIRCPELHQNLRLPCSITIQEHFITGYQSNSQQCTDINIIVRSTL